MSILNIIPSNISQQITNEIAYALGKMDFPRFYDYALWKPNIEEFEYVYFYNWFNPRQCSPDGQNWVWFMEGELREEMFKTLEQKLSYIRGRLAAYSVTITDTSIYVGYANSYGSRDRVEKFLNEILKDKFGGNKTWTIKKGETPGTIPGTPFINLIADSEIIKYITG